jgi:hypothetical protein
VRSREPLVWKESGTLIASKETEALSVVVPKVWGTADQLYSLEVSASSSSSSSSSSSHERVALASRPCRSPFSSLASLFLFLSLSLSHQWDFEADGDLLFGVQIVDRDGSSAAPSPRRGTELHAVAPSTMRKQKQMTLLPGSREARMEWTNAPGWAQLWKPATSVMLRYTISLKPLKTERTPSKKTPSKKLSS